MINSKNGLLLLDGFDEIANEIKKKQWLQHCTINENYCVIMTNRPNAIRSYLINPQMLNIIRFQSQDIQNYVCAYFKNIRIDDHDNSQEDLLIKKLNDNPSLKLLSYTPLYLRLFCYLTRQNKLLLSSSLDNIKDVYHFCNGDGLFSRINSFGFLQGQESMHPSHPMDPVYFPHCYFKNGLLLIIWRIVYMNQVNHAIINKYVQFSSQNML
ncbi:hypothetical protein RFI_01339 [Reticulomyxa filosa]|uniref:NACHT domain-containing protein n=1 Tax=Reticulomyxa filosa TaxID=46433 RepID=X6PC94_RETFI|nr:hypothetical protein RFI_01339 [Reticulomyxa filosa]|eukprot:ETO35723.1 hypothetical protein RFI_01339 [Reticulomyxa filosa]